MHTRDPYLVLGVPPVAKPEQIRLAYRELSKKFHPDLNQASPAMAAQRMKELTSAHDVISHRQRREDYDAQPYFKVRLPKGFDRGGRSSASFTRKKEAAQPGLMERLLTFLGQPPAPRSDPARAMTHFTMGVTMTEKKEFFEQARAEFAAAMKADPDLLEAAFNYGLMAYKLGDFDQARVGFQRVLQGRPKDAQVRWLLDQLRTEDP